MKKFERSDLDWHDMFDGTSFKEIKDDILPKLIKHYGENAIIGYDQTWDNYDFFIDVERQETAAEKAAREAKEQKQIQADRKRFENLKQKYGW